MNARSPVPVPGNTPAAAPVAIPAYLRKTYSWAYLDPRNVPLLDRPLVVTAILWGNASHLMNWAVEEFHAGEKVLQAACVYGDFSRRLAQRVGAGGGLDVVDVAPIQLAGARRKLAGLPWTRQHQADLAEYRGSGFDAVCCFFLLHEVPEPARSRIVANLLAAVPPGGRIVFVDYHRMAGWHPLRPIMYLVFRYLEPYAPSLLDADIAALAPAGADFDWRRETCFGGLYQKVVGVRRAAPVSR